MPNSPQFILWIGYLADALEVFAERTSFVLRAARDVLKL